MLLALKILFDYLKSTLLLIKKAEQYLLVIEEALLMW